jgi:hypothetical protein
MCQIRLMDLNLGGPTQVSPMVGRSNVGFFVKKKESKIANK